MNQAEVKISELTEAALTPGKTVIRSMKETGKKAFGCFPIYTPEEIIYAAGLLPVGMWGGQVQVTKADKFIQSFCCSIMRDNLELGMLGTYDILEGIIIPTFCDTMKAILANWSIAVPNCKAIPFVYPQNRLSTGSKDFLIAQYQRFQADLEILLGCKIEPQNMEKAFAVYEQYRAAMRDFTELVNDYPITLNPKTRHMIIKASYYMDKAVYTEKLTALMKAIKAGPKEKAEGPRVVITGLMTEPELLLDVFTECKYTFVADDLAQESRQFRTLARNDGTVLEKMAGRVLDLRGCTFFYEENKSRGTMLRDMVKRHNADGVVACMFKFCDPEEFDYPVFKQELDAARIPMLTIEIEQKMDSIEQLRTRIQSFAEMLR